MEEKKAEERDIEKELWFRDARATKAACPELDVMGPPCIVEEHIEQFLTAALDRQHLIPECEGVVLYVKIPKGVVKLTIEGMTEERFGPFQPATMEAVIERIAASLSPSDLLRGIVGEESTKIPE